MGLSSLFSITLCSRGMECRTGHWPRSPWGQWKVWLVCMKPQAELQRGRKVSFLTLGVFWQRQALKTRTVQLFSILKEIQKDKLRPHPHTQTFMRNKFDIVNSCGKFPTWRIPQILQPPPWRSPTFPFVNAGGGWSKEENGNQHAGKAKTEIRTPNLRAVKHTCVTQRQLYL